MHWDEVNEAALGAEEFGGQAKPLAAGTYDVEITHVSLKSWRDDDLELSVRCKVVAGDSKGQSEFFRFPVKNGNETIQAIGLGQLKKLYGVLGFKNGVKEPEELIDGTFKLKFIRKGEDGKYTQIRGIGPVEPSRPTNETPQPADKRMATVPDDDPFSVF